MFDVKTTDKAIQFVFSSRLDMIDRLIPLVIEFLEELQETSNSEYLRVVLRELLCNAVEHGNKLDHSKKVSGRIDQLSPCRYRCIISDEGDGIDESLISLTSTPDPERGRNMGFSIINSYSDEFKIEGSTVTAYVTLPVQTGFTVSNSDTMTVITPTGDISAAVSEQFRNLMITWIDGTTASLTVDFRNVTTIDSISLGVIVGIYRLKTKQHDTRIIRFTEVSAPLVDVFRLTQIHGMYHIEEQKSATKPLQSEKMQ